MVPREDLILGDLLKPEAQEAARLGAEIGPLHRALVGKQALRAIDAVFYVDRLDTEALRQHWQVDPTVDLGALQVDAVWGEHSLREALDRSALAYSRGLQGQALDYVVASHVVEHVPDLVGWLLEVAAVLRPGGALRLAVPDKRYCFDILRRTSSLPEVLEAHVCGWRRPSPRQVLDFALHEVPVDVRQAWADAVQPDALPRAHTLAGALQLAHDVHANGAYHDVHCWVFTPESWCALLQPLAQAGLVPFACQGLGPTAPDQLEFFVWLQRCEDPDAAAESWRMPPALPPPTPRVA